jgi:hypothetical protein
MVQQNKTPVAPGFTIKLGMQSLGFTSRKLLHPKGMPFNCICITAFNFLFAPEARPFFLNFSAVNYKNDLANSPFSKNPRPWAQKGCFCRHKTQRTS